MAHHREVAALLVQALEAAEIDRRTVQPVPQRVLAEQVYRKLQYDFPQVGAQELQALEMEVRELLWYVVQCFRQRCGLGLFASSYFGRHRQVSSSALTASL